MKDTLQGKKVAMLVANGFEQCELVEPRAAVDETGAETLIISPEKVEVKGWEDPFGDSFPVDVPLASADADNFDALLLPGGVMNPRRPINRLVSL